MIRQIKPLRVPLLMAAALACFLFAQKGAAQTTVESLTGDVATPSAAPAACLDSDGDGWGWDSENTCQIGSVASVASAACVDSDGDGWGWDGEKTCQIVNVTPEVSTTCIDSDGDGWGWDGEKTCQIVNVTPELSPACIDSDGDGWGWDGENPCQINNAVVTACVDSNGDGWGWDGVKTCTPEQQEPVVASAAPAVSDPVVSNVLVASVDEFELHWGGFPLIADISNKRLFMSVGEEFAVSSVMSAPLHYSYADSGYLISINGQEVSAGSVLSLSIQHGDAFAVDISRNNLPFDQYELVVTNLPIVQIDAENIQDEPKLPGTIRWIDGARSFDTGTMQLGIEYRGATAQAFDKKPFSIEFRDESGDGDNVRLLDLRNDDDWIADAAFRDQSFVRNLVSHGIYRDMRSYAYINDEGEPKGQSTIAGGLAELILNASYHGVYVVHERVDRKLLSLKKIDVPEDDSGDRWDLVDFSDPENGSALYKASTENSDFYSSGLMENEFEQKYPDDDDIFHYQPLYNLGSFIADSTNSDFNSQAAELIDFESVVDWWLLRLLTSNWDAFKKNYYPARSETQKWFIVPWDFDATFGMDWRGGVDPASIKFYEPERNNLVGRLTANPQNGFNAMAKARWAELRASLFTADAIAARFAFYADQLDRGGVFGVSPRQRNLQRWPGTGNTGVGNPELADTDYIRAWLTSRLLFVDGKMNELPE